MFSEALKREYDINTPIFAEEIIKQFSNLSRAYVFRLINKAVSEGTLNCFTRGVYYLPRKTFFGSSSICAEMVAEKKYIKSNDSVYGIYAGLNLLNQFGLTTQVPNTIEIVTNNEATRKRKITIEGRQFILRKARCEITVENYPVYTLLQLFTDMDNSDNLDDFSKRRISEFITENNIRTEQLSSMAMSFPAATIKKMVRSGIINVIVQQNI